ncbi:hypothetical protein W911_08170 [Hyphomicrobium nitrativorans NL23]|uniref:Uncharacterized protein n=1 Tax=Hyphomicrobium nitrativorans NL23 TaxID=1029756 RepID=V5SHY0_9HYPH|nr:hypothetical protein [Hyphomicrobium nitrativorans]AHB50107.1 hypothetical protein W911_08170 [Hyphomicrobium nitrativorans NL23]
MANDLNQALPAAMPMAPRQTKLLRTLAVALVWVAAPAPLWIMLGLMLVI